MALERSTLSPPKHLIRAAVAALTVLEEISWGLVMLSRSERPVEVIGGKILAYEKRIRASEAASNEDVTFGLAQVRH